MSRPTRLVLIALALAFVARLATYPLAGIHDPLFYEYGYIAKHLLAGEGYSLFHWLDGEIIKVPSAFMPPGQTYITAFFFWAFGIGSVSYHLLFLFNAALGTAAVYLLYRITRLITTSDRAAIIALFGAAVFPPFLSASATWGVASSVLFLNGLLIYSALRLSQAIRENSRPTWHAMRLGAVAGILALFRAEAPMIVGLILIGLLMVHRAQLASAFKHAVSAGLVMLIVMSPWTIANFIRFDALILGSTSGGFNLWRGNNPTASGGGWRADGSLVAPDNKTHREILNKLRAVPPLQWERAYSAELAKRATEWMAENPGTVAALALKKAALIWILDPYHYSNTKYIYAFFQVIAFGMGVVGVLSLRKHWSADIRSWLWIAGAACLGSTLIVMVFFSLPRYQIFLVSIYFPMVAIGADALLVRSRSRRTGNDERVSELVAS